MELRLRSFPCFACAVFKVVASVPCLCESGLYGKKIQLQFPKVETLNAALPRKFVPFGLYKVCRKFRGVPDGGHS